MRVNDVRRHLLPEAPPRGAGGGIDRTLLVNVMVAADFWNDSAIFPSS
jgi:hypothetical protein